MPTEKHQTTEHPKAPKASTTEVGPAESAEGVPYQVSGLYEDGEENPGPYTEGEGKNAPGYEGP